MPMQVRVMPHRAEWADGFAAEAARLRGALGPCCVAVHHVGSTAIPGIVAKPILDLLVEADAIEHVDARRDAVVALGYEAMGEYGLPGRRYFRQDDDRGVRTHHVHAYAAGHPDVARHLAFRDFLRAHTQPAQAYSELKANLAAEHPDDMEAYIDGKDPFIQRVERDALAWWTKTRPGPADGLSSCDS
ncbi:MAG: GrpB family protein [Planctomycetota bacterium]